MLARRALIPVALFAAFAAFLTASFAVFHRQNDDHLQQQSAATARSASLHLRDFVSSRLLALQTLVPQMEAGRLRDRESFASAARALYEGFPGFQAINWTTPDGRLKWVNPPSSNRAALGKSVFEHPQAGVFARRAAASRELVLTSPVDLFQGMRGFVVYVPVISDRRSDGSDGGSSADLLGLLNGVFSVERLIKGALESGLLGGYEVHIADGDEGLLSSAGFGAAIADGRPEGHAAVQIAGRRWRLHVVPGDTLWAKTRHGHGALLAISLILAAGLSALLSIALTARRRGRRLARARLQLAQLVNASMDPMGLLRPDGTFRYLNPAGRALLGIGAEDKTPPAATAIAANSRDRLAAIGERLNDVGHWEGEVELDVPTDDRPVPVYARAFAIPAVDDESEALVGLTCLDLRDQKRLQLELQHATKMESVGRLAGGVAHDFNNLLTAMTSYATLLRCSDELPESLVADVDEILATAQRGASLTRQLLAFARKDTSESSEVDVGSLLLGMKKLLRRVLRADIRLTLNISSTAGTSLIDAGQLEQTILNLCINSIDAMPDGGELTVAADRYRPNGRDYCRIVVRDTGTGMTAEVADKAFDPFFTTKPVGKGTGLGLSSVYGLITAAGGTISLESEPGRGTEITILLPRTGDGAEDAESVVTPIPKLDPVSRDVAHRPRVLLVEDEAAVRRASKRILERGGLEVVAVRDGVDAMNEVANDQRGFDIIVSDVVMPRMGGVDMVDRLREAGVTVPVLLCSGYNEQELNPEVLGRLGCERLEKPFAPTELLEQVERLAANRIPSPSGRANSAT